MKLKCFGFLLLVAFLLISGQYLFWLQKSVDAGVYSKNLKHFFSDNHYHIEAKSVNSGIIRRKLPLLLIIYEKLKGFNYPNNPYNEGNTFVKEYFLTDDEGNEYSYKYFTALDRVYFYTTNIKGGSGLEPLD